MAKTDMTGFVPKQLMDKARLYAERNALYGDNYKRFGVILTCLLDGQQLDASDVDQMNRLGVFVQIVSKMTRYGNLFTIEPHADSLDDIAVYSMMLKELDQDWMDHLIRTGKTLPEVTEETEE